MGGFVRKKIAIILGVMAILMVLAVPVQVSATAAGTWKYGGTTVYRPAQQSYVEFPITFTVDWDESMKTIALVNEERRAAGLREMVLDSYWMEIALDRIAETMFHYSHFRPVGWLLAGENLAAGGGGTGNPLPGARLYSMWNRSPGHHEAYLWPDHIYTALITASYNENHERSQRAVHIFSKDLHGEVKSPASYQGRKTYKRNVLIRNDNIVLCIGDGTSRWGVWREPLTVGDKEPIVMPLFEIDQSQTITYDRLMAESIYYPPASMLRVISSNPSVCAFENGRIVAKKAGTATVTISLKNHPEVKSTVPVTVKENSTASSSGATKKMTVKLAKTSVTYNGKAQKPKATVYVNGKKLSSSAYSISYKNNKNVGVATVTVKGKGNYRKFSASATFRITLKKTVLSSVQSSKKRTMTVKWKRAVGNAGYQVQYSTNKRFKTGNKIQTVSGAKKTSCTIKRLASRKTYYVRMRTYKKVGGKYWYSPWSSVKKVKVK